MFFLVLALLASWPVWRVVCLARLAVALERARTVLDDPQRTSLRIASPGHGLAAWTARALPDVRTHLERLELAAQLQSAGRRAEDHRRAHATAIAHLVAGEPGRAGAAFEALPPHNDDARAWNDLAAVQAAGATATGNAAALIAALAAADRALALAPSLAEARFNRAAIIEAFGITVAARREWTTFLELPAEGPWPAVARQRVAALVPDEKVQWETATNVAAIEDEDFVRLATRFPELARRYAEGPYLSHWALARQRGDTAGAARWLHRTRVIAKFIQDRGDTLIADTLAAIDSGRKIDDVARGYIAYASSRAALKNYDRAAAEAELRTAVRSFTAAGSPMAATAEVYLAITLFEQTRIAEACAMFGPLLAAERRIGTHKSLLARILLQTALCHASRGFWSDSLAAAQESAAISQSLGEDSTTAAALAILSENYDFMGHPELARQHALNALRKASLYGAHERLRPIVAAMSRTELRGGRWQWARSLMTLEESLRASLGSVPDLDADLFQRIAGAEFHLGNTVDSKRAMARARVNAADIPDEGARKRLVAGIDAVEGAITRAEDPVRARTLLTAAIAFHVQAQRPFFLPELYLERARAALACGDPDAAQRDLDLGIGELERQRSTIRDAELQPGLFDDAAELFHDAVSLQLMRGASPEKVLAYAERGRARTLLEQLDADAPSAPDLAALQRRLGPGRVMVEYIALPDRLVIMVISADRPVVRTVDVARETLAGEAEAFADALSSGDRRRADGGSRRLHDLLITPIEAELRNRIVVVADDILQRVPFGALFNAERETYLVEHHDIAYSPSAGVFMAPSGKHRDRNKVARSVLVFANPTIPRDRYPALPSLGAAEREGKAVARPYVTAHVLERDEATAQRFLLQAPAHHVVHFGGHGVNSRREPASSELICADDGSGARVTARQIARMKFELTEVVVLAACSTMTGRNAAMEGVASLGRAFLVAGVPEVVGTLWDIQDRDAAPLMASLHQQLARGVPAAEALSNTQRAALRSGNPDRQNPRHWAAFTVMGSTSD